MWRLRLSMWRERGMKGVFGKREVHCVWRERDGRDICRWRKGGCVLIEWERGGRGYEVR